MEQLLLHKSITWARKAEYHRQKVSPTPQTQVPARQNSKQIQSLIQKRVLSGGQVLSPQVLLIIQGQRASLQRADAPLIKWSPLPIREKKSQASVVIWEKVQGKSIRQSNLRNSFKISSLESSKMARLWKSKKSWGWFFRVNFKRYTDVWAGIVSFEYKGHCWINWTLASLFVNHQVKLDLVSKHEQYTQILIILKKKKKKRQGYSKHSNKEKLMRISTGLSKVI